MTNPKGMTLTEFYGILEDMRKCYPFKDETTRLSNMIDMRDPDFPREVEIATVDVETGVEIIMHKGVSISLNDFGYGG